MSDAIGSAYVTIGKYFSATSHPALMRSRAASRNWYMSVKPHIQEDRHKGLTSADGRDHGGSTDRVTAGFEYVGPPNAELARRLGLSPKP